MSEYIEIKGARVNNLKNVDVRIPRNKFVVIAGVSGSGKSSLAFDTLYAEGQRRYVESLSSYARQFLGRMNKPECDFIRGIPPAIAIEQKVIARNPRSTVGTSTEIYEYLRLLFARIGHTYSPVSGQEVKKHSTEDIVRQMLQYQKGTKFVIMAPVRVAGERTLEQQLKAYLLEGYSRIFVDGDFLRIDNYLEDANAQTSNLKSQTSNLKSQTSNLKPLRIFGGFEMVAAIGAMLRAAEQHLVVLIDGFIMTACAIAAIRLCPASQDYMIFTHCGDESGHQRMLDIVKAKPLLHLGLRLGEGTGALCAFPIVDSAVRMMNEMNNFDNAKITKYF